MTTVQKPWNHVLLGGGCFDWKVCVVAAVQLMCVQSLCVFYSLYPARHLWFHKPKKVANKWQTWGFKTNPQTSRGLCPSFTSILWCYCRQHRACVYICVYICVWVFTLTCSGVWERSYSLLRLRMYPFVLSWLICSSASSATLTASGLSQPGGSGLALPSCCSKAKHKSSRYTLILYTSTQTSTQ